MNPKNLIWLASYPKSGNTWTRAFLNNYVVNADKPVPINEMHRFTFGDSITALYEKVHGGSLNGLNEQAILRIRAKLLLRIAHNGADLNFLKTHNVNDKAFGQVLIPPPLTRLAIYIVRNPLDVVLSYARHFGMDHEKTVATIAHPHNTTIRDENTVKEFIGPWSVHVDSWTRTKAFPVHVMRFEDMKSDPQKTFGALVRKMGLPFDPERLDRAIEHASFKELKRQEETYGFVEQSRNSATFFHAGKTDQWKTQLTPELVEKVRQDQGKVMRRFGYF